MGTDIHLQVQRRNSEGNWLTVAPPMGYNDVDSWMFKNYTEAVDRLPEGVTVQDVLDGTVKDRGMDMYYIKKYHTSWYDGRNYNLFSMLADVRNGHGFAGVPTGGGFVPISMPRGLPDDVKKGIYDEEVEDYVDGFYYGDHSFSHLSLKELLDYDWTQVSRLCGVIPLPYFVLREKEGITGCPVTWSGDISGRGIATLEASEARELLDKDILTVNDEELENTRKWVENTEKTKSFLSEEGLFDSRRQIKYYVRAWWARTYEECAGDFYTRVIPALKELDPNPENVRIVFGFDS